MNEFDDDERAKAFDRAVFIEFANIVQNYDETARPEHDDIQFEPGDYDSAEFDLDGEPVTLYGLIVINLGPAYGDLFDDDIDDPFDYLYDRLRGLRKPRREDLDDSEYPDTPWLDNGDL